MMVYSTDLSGIEWDDLILAKLWHGAAGLYFWEFVTTFGYEWRVIRGHSPYRWTIWIYSLTRTAGLLGMILTLVGIDTANPINCQVWVSFVVVFIYLSAASASLLIVLRVIAIWNRNTVTTAVAISVWGINIVFLIQGAAQVRSTWVPSQSTCVVANSKSCALTLVAMVVTDIMLLLIMLVGLLRLRRHGGGTYGIAQLLWKQGVYWLLLATVAGVPPIVLNLLDLNNQLSSIFQAPSLITMTIAATRMYRSLVDFSSRSFEVAHGIHQLSGLTFSKAKRSRVISIPLQPTEISVNMVFEQHPTPHMNHHDSCAKTDGEVYMKSSSSGLDDDVECGVMK